MSVATVSGTERVHPLFAWRRLCRAKVAFDGRDRTRLDRSRRSWAGWRLVWAVTPEGSPEEGFCNLHRGQTYYLNIVAAELGADPTVTTCTADALTHADPSMPRQCANNYKSTGNFNGTQGM